MSRAATYRVFVLIEKEDDDNFTDTREKCIGVFDGDDEYENELSAMNLFDWIVDNS